MPRQCVIYDASADEWLPLAWKPMLATKYDVEAAIWALVGLDEDTWPLVIRFQNDVRMKVGMTETETQGRLVVIIKVPMLAAYRRRLAIAKTKFTRWASPSNIGWAKLILRADNYTNWEMHRNPWVYAPILLIRVMWKDTQVPGRRYRHWRENSWHHTPSKNLITTWLYDTEMSRPSGELVPMEILGPLQLAVIQEEFRLEREDLRMRWSQ